jgi:hypothetical protein
MKEIWTTVHGGWGDFIANYGNIRVALEENQADKANVVFYGLDKDIIKFIKAQKYIGEVLHLQISNKADYWRYANMAFSDFLLYKKLTGLDKKIPDLIPTHITHFYNNNPHLCNRYFDMVLPTPQFDWTDVLPKEPFIVFQPFSCHSCSYKKHWPYWMDALDFILNLSPFKVVLIGQARSIHDSEFIFPWVEHPNLVNIVGQTPNVIDVMHIMSISLGVITTSNVLSMWSVVSNKPALVVCNQVIKEFAMLYYNWIHHEPNLVLDSDVNLEEFKDAAKNFLKGLV